MLSADGGFYTDFVPSSTKRAVSRAYHAIMDIFKTQPRLHNGIYRALDHRPKVPLAQSSNFWPITAHLYEPLWRKRSISLLTNGEFSVEQELELMLEWLQPKPQQRILDVACSAGLYTRTLLKHQALELHGLDFSLPFLQKAQLYAERDQVSMILVQADVNGLPYQDEVFDQIVCGGSLNEFLDVPQALAEFTRVLKPGGKMWQMYLSHADANLGKIIQGMLRLSGIRFIDLLQLEIQTAKVGLTLVKTQHYKPVILALYQKPDRSNVRLSSVMSNSPEALDTLTKATSSLSATGLSSNDLPS